MLQARKKIDSAKNQHAEKRHKSQPHILANLPTHRQ
jgi:hypothetical protein